MKQPTLPPLKINIVLGQQLVFPPTRGGGVENLNWLLACEFARLGHTVVAYSRLVPGLSRRETDKSGIIHVRLTGDDHHSSIVADHANAVVWSLRLFSVIENADVTSFHTPFSFLLRNRKGLGVCTHTIHRTPKRHLPVYRWMDRVYCGGDAVVRQALAIAPTMKNVMRVYNCMGLPSESGAAVPKRQNSQSLEFLYVGRFVPDKGLESLIKGFEHSLTDFPENRLKTVGPQTSRDGADEAFFQQFKSYVEMRGLSDKISFIPPVFDRDKLGAIINAADVVCVPSLTGETFSMAVLDGMAKAKPVLVSDFGSMPEAIDHLTNGYIARAGDASAIAKAIAFFSRQKEGLQKLGEQALTKAQSFFSASTVAQEYLDDFYHLIEEKRRGCRQPS